MIFKHTLSELITQLIDKNIAKFGWVNFIYLFLLLEVDYEWNQKVARKWGEKQSDNFKIEKTIHPIDRER